MDIDLEQRLLASIQENRLVLFTGAGLSRSAPSSIPGAAALAAECAASYARRGLPHPLPPESDTKLEVLTDFFVANDLQTFFVNELVSWRPFRRNPNKGHGAIADLLTCGAIHSSITTNYDELVELSAMGLGEDDFAVALDLLSANSSRTHRPLIKIHGCIRDKMYTLWCSRQLAAPPPTRIDEEIQRRLESCQTWLSANLVDKDIVFVGFWSDWAYLTPILAHALNTVRASFVVLVDPSDRTFLSTKAPELWAWANTATTFRHVMQSGDQFLEELRFSFAANFMRRTLLQSLPGFDAANPRVPNPAVDFPGASNDDLYSLRRDTVGVSGARIARMSAPDPSTEGVGRIHLKLRSAGAVFDGRYYQLVDGRKVRVVNGRTQVLSRVRETFFAEPSVPPAISEDIVICAGAYDDGGAATHVLRPSVSSTVIRSGAVAEWLTENAATDQHIL